MIYITHEEGNVKTIFNDAEFVPQSLIDEVIAVESVPNLTEVYGKQAYHFYNGETVEVRYTDRPLTETEKIEELRTILAERDNKIAILEEESTANTLSVLDLWDIVLGG